MSRSPSSSAPKPWTAFLMAVQFLVLSPTFIARMFTGPELGRAVAFFPWVGLLLGGVLWGLNFGLSFVFSPMIRAALVLAAWIVLTGGLHLDGFLDACDGLLGGSTPEERLRILKDERIGAFAFAGGILLLLLKWSALVALPVASPALLAAPILGRMGMALAIFAFPYAREKGLGREMKDYTGRGEAGFAALSAAALAALVAGLRGGIAAGVALLVLWAVGRFTLKRIPGLTGDLYGAINEITEVCVLLVLVAG